VYDTAIHPKDNAIVATVGNRVALMSIPAVSERKAPSSLTKVSKVSKESKEISAGSNDVAEEPLSLTTQKLSSVLMKGDDSPGEDLRLRRLHFSANGKWIFVAGDDCRIYLLEYPSLQLQGSFGGDAKDENENEKEKEKGSNHNNGIIALELTPDGLMLVTLSLAGVLQVWDRHSGECLAQLTLQVLMGKKNNKKENKNKNENKNKSMDMQNGGDKKAARPVNRIQALKQQQQQQEQQGQHASSTPTKGADKFCGMALGMQGTCVYIATREKKQSRIYAVDLSSWEIMQSALAHRHGISAFAAHENGQLVISGSVQGEAAVFTAGTLDCIFRQVVHGLFITSLCHLPNDHALVTVSVDRAARVIVYKPKSQQRSIIPVLMLILALLVAWWAWYVEMWSRGSK
jgi:WD40 repeat protein